MKILHLINTYAPIGGIETYVLKLLPILEAQGHENVIIYRTMHARTPATTTRTAYCVPETADERQDRQHIVNLVRQVKPSVIYLHDIYDPEVISQIADLAPVVGYIHIFYPLCPGLGKLFHQGDAICRQPFGVGCIPQIYLRRCASAKDPRSVYAIMRKTAQFIAAYKKVAQVVVASRYMQELLVQNRFEETQIEVLPPHFVEECSSGVPVGVPVADPAESPYFFFVGRLEYEKGVAYLLRALTRTQPAYKLLIAGEGSRKEEYVQLAANLGISHRVEFCNWLPEETLHTTYRGSIATVMPTIMPEPFGKVGIEAMTQGRPVVAFDVGGISDWLIDGHNGFLVPARDIEKLAAQLDRLAKDRELASRLGKNGRAHVVATYSPESHVTRLLQIFDKAAQARC